MKILVVDDDRFIRQILEAIINEAGHTATLAENADVALEKLGMNDIDLVLMDVEMPGKNGYELTREIRNTYPNNWFPIIFLSGQTDEKHFEEGINAGGDDYLAKPVSPIILTAKIHAMERIANMKSALDEANARLEKLSSQDPLTKLSNRRDLDQNLLKEWKRHQREHNEMCAIMMDIDFFKLYNDNYGHQMGDECLKNVAKVLKGCLSRSHDLLARYGGEEFAIILPDTSLNGAEEVAQRIIDSLQERNIPHQYSKVSDRISMSLGISSTLFGADTPTTLLKQADSALYKTKESGRNGYRCYSVG